MNNIAEIKMDNRLNTKYGMMDRKSIDKYIADNKLVPILNNVKWQKIMLGISSLKINAIAKCTLMNISEERLIYFDHLSFGSNVFKGSLESMGGHFNYLQILLMTFSEYISVNTNAPPIKQEFGKIHSLLKSLGDFGLVNDRGDIVVSGYQMVK